MRPLRFANLWRLIGFGIALAVLVASLMPPPEVMQTISDKFMHVLAYLVMAAWFGAVYQRRWHVAVLLVLVAFGVVIEFLQLQTGYRSFEVRDMLADALGGIIGIILAGTSLGNGLQWLERRVVVH